MQTKAEFDLKSYSYALLDRGFFCSESEKNQYAMQLEQVLHELVRIHTELVYLRPEAPIKLLITASNLDNADETEIVRLIRRVHNRLKVLPVEPVEPTYSRAMESVAISL